MTKEEISQAVADGLKPLVERIVTLEAKAKSAPGTETLDQNPTIVSLESRLKILETNTNATVQASAKATVEAIGVKAGRIAAQDKDTIAFWETAIAANAKAADALSKMPVNPAFVQTIAHGAVGPATGTNGAPIGTDKATADKVAAKARAHMNAGKKFDEAWQLATGEVMAGA